MSAEPLDLQRAHTGSDAVAWMTAVAATRRAVGDLLTQSRRSVRSKRERRTRTALRRVWHFNQRRVFREIKSEGPTHVPMVALAHPIHGVVCTPAAILDAVTFHMGLQRSKNTADATDDTPPWAALRTEEATIQGPDPSPPAGDKPCPDGLHGLPADMFNYDAGGMPSETLSQLDYNLVAQVVSKRKNGRAPGPDGIPNEIYKYAGHAFRAYLTSIFRLYYRHSHTPDAWKDNVTMLVYKGDPHRLSQWRPLGLLNTMYRLWTACLTSILSKVQRWAAASTMPKKGSSPSVVPSATTC